MKFRIDLQEQVVNGWSVIQWIMIIRISSVEAHQISQYILILKLFLTLVLSQYSKSGSELPKKECSSHTSSES